MSPFGAWRCSRMTDKNIEWRARTLLKKLKEVKMSRCVVFYSHSTNWILLWRIWRNKGMFDQRTSLIFPRFQENEYGHYIVNISGLHSKGKLTTYDVLTILHTKDDIIDKNVVIEMLGSIHLVLYTFIQFSLKIT